MTTSIADEIARLRGKPIGHLWQGRPPSGELWTFDEALRVELQDLIKTQTGARFPSDRWKEDPVGFCREVLGIEPWSKQVEILEAVRDHTRVAVKSGHKIGKSATAAIVALWFYCSFKDARVVMTSTTSRQVDDILWREVKMMRARAGFCTECKPLFEGRQDEAPCEHSGIIDGEIGDLARTGLKSVDFREIKGFTAREAEAVAGISGPALLYIVDEASGVRKEIFEAIEGNRAGGARLVMYSNPTRTEGEFFDAFHSKSKFYSCHTVSSEETPNAVYGEDDPRAIPGLAWQGWIDEKKEEWGEDSPMYLVRVKGEFAQLEEGKIFSIHDIDESVSRWDSTPEEGRLYIGLDPAGDGPSGDETAWSCRRGQKQIKLIAKSGLSKESILAHTLGLCSELGQDREVPVVVVDVEGKVGSELNGTIVAFLSNNPEPPFQFVPVRASDRAHRRPIVYDRMRDELAGVLLDWMNEGGSFCDDPKLATELHALEWREELNGRVKVTSKKELRKLLGRSPDRYDATALSVWEPLHVREGPPPRRDTVSESSKQQLDPYDNTGIDPYR